jgi:hypothetical protein
MEPNLTAGMSPVSNLGDAITKVALLAVFRFINVFYLKMIFGESCPKDHTRNVYK